MAKAATLYRYRSLAGDGFRFVQDIFFRNRLYWPFHSQLNDPAEGIFRHVLSPVKRRDGLWYSQGTRLLSPNNDVRVLSFSEDPAHPLMWAHYADAHRGICVGVHRAFFSDVVPVRYPERVPRLAPNLPKKKKLTAAFLTKRAAWAYEREWRLIGLDHVSEENRYVQLRDGVIKQIIFGARTSRDDRDWIFQWLKLSGCRARTRRVRFSGAAARLHLEDFGERDNW